MTEEGDFLFNNTDEPIDTETVKSMFSHAPVAPDAHPAQAVATGQRSLAIPNWDREARRTIRIRKPERIT